MKVVPLDSAAETLYLKGKIKLARLVRIEMNMLGYDPNDEKQLLLFWNDLSVLMAEEKRNDRETS